MTIQIYTDLYSIFYLIVQYIYIYIYLIDSIDSIDSIDRAIISESISINQLRLWKVGSCHVPAAPQLNFWRWYPLVTHGKPSALIGKTCTNGTFHYGNLWHKETSNMANKRSVLDAAWCPSDSTCGYLAVHSRVISSSSRVSRHHLLVLSLVSSLLIPFPWMNQLFLRVALLMFCWLQTQRTYIFVKPTARLVPEQFQSYFGKPLLCRAVASPLHHGSSNDNFPQEI